MNHTSQAKLKYLKQLILIYMEGRECSTKYKSLQILSPLKINYLTKKLLLIMYPAYDIFPSFCFPENVMYFYL